MPYQPTYPRDPYTVGTTTFYSNTDRHAPPEYETIEMNELAPVDTPSSQPTTQESRRRPSDLQVGARRRRIGRNELPEPATQPDAQPDAQPARRWLPTFRWSEREDGTETLENARWEIRLYIIIIYFLLFFIVIMNILYNFIYNVYYGRALRGWQQRCQS